LVSQIEQGQKADPRLSTVAALAKALGVTLDDLAGDPGQAGEEQPPPKKTARGRKT
jgi:transcriptional regulator with XRE-family HTH domain